MITLEVHHSNTYIKNIEAEDKKFILRLNAFLSFRVQNFKFLWRYKNTQWDGKEYLLNGHWQNDVYVPNYSSLSFRTGLLDRVIDFCKMENVNYVIVDERIYPKLPKPIKWIGALRDYQQKAVDDFIKHRRGIIAAATGSGKSLIITNIVSQINLPTVILCGTIDLVYQMVDHLETELENVKVGVVGDGICDIQRITVSTWQSAARAIDKKANVYFYDYKVKEKFDPAKADDIKNMLKSASFIVLDESHCARAKTVQTILKAVDVPYLLGTSATPVRDEGDDLLIEAEFGQIFCNISASSLIKKGWLVKPKIEYHYIHNDKLIIGDQVAKGSGEFHAIYKAHIVENENRNQLICDKAREMVLEGRKVLILVDYLESHGKILEEMLSDIKAEFLHSKVTSKKRKTLIKAFRSGEIDCVIATALADEGLDVPIISGEILAGGKRGKTKIKQRVGRALRPYQGKSDAKIIDFIDDGKFVLDHSLSRIASLKSEPEYYIMAYGVPSEKREHLKARIMRRVKRVDEDESED